MLYPSELCSYNFSYNNWGDDPTTTPGTSVTPGASNGEGSWTQIASSSNISSDCYWLYLKIYGGSTTANAKNHLLDVGVDPAGGTSYTEVIANIVCGGSPGLTSAGGTKEYVFPFFIKSGSSVAVRIQGSNATAGTVGVAAYFVGKPTKPECAPVGMFSETLGSISNSNGTSFTPGNLSDGSWVDLGATSKAMWWWQVCYQVDNASLGTKYVYIDVAWGDTSNKHIMFRVMHGSTTSETCALMLSTQLMNCNAYHYVPAGSNIYIRGRGATSPDTGFNATVVGVGG